MLKQKPKFLVALAVALCATAVASAQELEAKYKKKLSKDFVKKIEWVHSLEEAKHIAKETGKPIFGYFTRSYSP